MQGCGPPHVSQLWLIACLVLQGAAAKKKPHDQPQAGGGASLGDMDAAPHLRSGSNPPPPPASEEPPTRTMNGQHPLQRSHRSIPEVEQEAGEDELQDEFAAMRDTKSSRR